MLNTLQSTKLYPWRGNATVKDRSPAPAKQPPLQKFAAILTCFRAVIPSFAVLQIQKIFLD